MNSIDENGLNLFVRHANINGYVVGKPLPVIFGKARTLGIKASFDGTIWGVSSRQRTVTQVSDNGINIEFEQSFLADDDGVYTVIETRNPLRNPPEIQSVSTELNFSGSLRNAYKLLGGSGDVPVDSEISYVFDRDNISRHRAINTLMAEAGYTINPQRFRDSVDLTGFIDKDFTITDYVSLAKPAKSVRVLYNYDFADKIYRSIDVIGIAGHTDDPEELHLKAVTDKTVARLIADNFLTKHENPTFKCTHDKLLNIGDSFILPVPNVAPGNIGTVIMVDLIKDISEIEIWTLENSATNQLTSIQNTERFSEDRQVNETIKTEDGIITYQLLDEKGLGIEGAIVFLTDQEGNTTEFLTDGDGNFVFQGEDGDRFTLSVELSGSVINEFEIVV
jgi:hypothetical protein